MSRHHKKSGNSSFIASPKKMTEDSSRRRFCLGLGGLSFLPWLTPSSFSAPVLAESEVPKRFVHIFLSGGWDSAFATDPVVGSKLASGNYASNYSDHDVGVVPGKESLQIGEGLLGAKEALAKINCAFVNGIFIPVPAHDLASRYVQTGRFTLSRSQNFPGFVAKLGEQSNHFPAHVALGSVPLGETKYTAPPLMATGLTGIRQVLQPPTSIYNYTPQASAAINQAITDLDQYRFGSVGENLDFHRAWFESKRLLQPLYQKRFDQTLEFSQEIQQRYNTTDELSQPGKLATAFLLLRSGISPYISADLHGYDTHLSFTPQLDLQKEFAAALSVFIEDLIQTSDPDRKDLTLAQTTTVLISSEFVRTPKINLSGGTDHWESTSVIFLGRGISDGVVFGKTGDDAHALGVENGNYVSRTDSNQLRPEELAATVASLIGLPDLANEYSERKLGVLI